MVTIVFALFAITKALIPALSAQLQNILEIPVLFTTFIGTFYWIDTSVLAARLSDLLLRDSLHWRRIRIVIYAYDFSAAAIISSYIAYLRPGSYGVLSFEALGGTIPTLLITLLSGAIALPIVARRSKDKTLRRHLRWFGLYAVVFLVAASIVLALSFLSGHEYNLVSAAITAGAGYFLYRSARSLVPLYSFATETEAKR